MLQEYQLIGMRRAAYFQGSIVSKRVKRIDAQQKQTRTINDKPTNENLSQKPCSEPDQTALVHSLPIDRSSPMKDPSRLTEKLIDQAVQRRLRIDYTLLRVRRRRHPTERRHSAAIMPNSLNSL